MTTNIDLSGQEINDLDSNEMMDTFDVELGSLNPSNKFSRSFISQPSISRYSIFSDKGETSLRKESRGLESQNSSLAFFNAPTLDKRTSSFKYCYSEKKEWLCDSQIRAFMIILIFILIVFLTIKNISLCLFSTWVS